MSEQGHYSSAGTQSDTNPEERTTRTDQPAESFDSVGSTSVGDLTPVGVLLLPMAIGVMLLSIGGIALLFPTLPRAVGGQDRLKIVKVIGTILGAGLGVAFFWISSVLLAKLGLRIRRRRGELGSLHIFGVWICALGVALFVVSVDFDEGV